MADSSANLKVKGTMDNSDIKKKCKESKDALRDFSQVGSESMNKLGEAFGINTEQIGKISNVLNGLGLKLQQTGSEGAAAFGKMLSGISGFAAGVAGLSFAGALAGMKALSEEAENFKTTLEGANIDAATTAYVDTYKQVIHDFNREMGKGFADVQSKWKKFWGTAGSTIKAYVTSGAIVSALNPQAQGFEDGRAKYQEMRQQAKEAASEAERISNDIYDVQRQLSDKAVEWSRAERDIAEYKRIGYDKTVDTATQQQALASAVALINKRYQEEAELRGRLADLQEEYNSLAESSLADIDKANQLRIQEENTIARMNNALRELSERQATVTQNAEKEAKARMDALEAYEKMALHKADTELWVANTPAQIETPNKAVQMNAPGIIVPVKPELDTTSVIDITNELQQIMTSSFDTIGEAIGGLIGDLATGGDAWENFSNVAISAFADLATYVGKTAIATGTATLGIKAALESLNGYAAIAAGVALVALGAAVKASLSNIASGSYSASSSVASASGSYGSSSSGFGTGFETREMTVNVTGTLRADGNQLLTVIENENKRKNHTT